MIDAGYQSLQTVALRLHERPLGAPTLLRTGTGTSPRTTYTRRVGVGEAARLSARCASSHQARLTDTARALVGCTMEPAVVLES